MAERAPARLQRAGSLDDIELPLQDEPPRGPPPLPPEPAELPAPHTPHTPTAAHTPAAPSPHSPHEISATTTRTAAARSSYPTDDDPSWRGPSGRLYSSASFFCLRPSHEPRRFAILTVEHRFFEPLILFTILANCATMAWESPLDPPGTMKARFINDYAEWVYLYIFTGELAIKVLAYGFMGHRGSYLRDAWCQLDFVVVTLAWLPIIFPGFGNFSALRAFRALRPLRALKRVPGMPVLIQWIVDVLPRLGSVVMLCGFVLLVFGIVGMELFKGSLHYRCAEAGLALAGPTDEQSDFDTGVACKTVTSDDGGVLDSCTSIEPGWTCTNFEANPDGGLTSFDSVGLALIVLMKTIVFDEWSVPMYDLMASFSPYVSLYFLMIVAIGGFFIVNLFLAVIFLELESTKAAVDKSEARELKEEGEEEGGEGGEGGGNGGGEGGGGTPSPGGRASRTGIRPSSRSSSDGRQTPLLEGGTTLSDGTIAGDGAAGGVGGALTSIAKSDWLSNVATALVGINMILMCMPYYGMTEGYARCLELGASIITWLFIVEMTTKLLGLGCKGYWSDGWNQLDGTIVTMSIVDMVLTAIFASSGVKLSFLRILRILRVLRVLRLMRSWKGLYNIITTFIRAIPQMGNIFVLILLTMFMFSLVGMQLFGGLFDEEAGYALEPCAAGGTDCGGSGDLIEKPHYHFDHIFPAMVTVFIMLTGEFADAMHAVTAVAGVKACIFFIIAVVIGKYLLLNLLVAVILTEFAAPEKDSTSSPSKQKSGGGKRAGFGGSDAGTPPPGTPPPGAPGVDDADRPSSPVAFESARGGSSNGTPKWPDDYALFCFSPLNPFRRFCRALMEQPLFEQVVIVAIIASSAGLALDTPRLDPTSELASVLKRADLIFIALFTLEMTTKIVALGFFSHRDAYLRSMWNQLDFVIVVSSILTLAAEWIPWLRPLRVLRVLRVLRPLRLIARNAGMRLILTSLFKAMPAASNVLSVVMALQLVFAIVGMQLFSGRLASTPKLVWKNPAVGSFDDFGQSMRLLYVMSTGDQWEIPMFLMMGSQPEPDVAPQRNDYSPMAIFSLLWVFVGFIFAINLFVGVVVDTFNRIQQTEKGTASMTPEQHQWVISMKAVMKSAPTRVAKPPDDPGRRVAFDAVTSALFDSFITFVIVLNIGVMACDYYGIEDDAETLLLYNRAMDAFSIIYYIECVSKLYALGCDGYFGDPWCRFDFFLVCTSLVDQFASELLAEVLPMPPMLLRVLRVFRILRILRLLKGAKGLRDLLVTMILSFPSLINVGSVLMLILFIYSVVGLNLFTFVVHGGPEDGINDARNFDTFGGAFLVLFQCLTGDDWSSIMADALVDESSGRCSASEGNCGSPAAIPYFISVQLVGSFVFLNLVVAVVLENFALMTQTNPNLVSAPDVEAFTEVWTEYDPDASNYIPWNDLPSLLLKVPRPLGLRGKTIQHAERMCIRLRLTVHPNGIAYKELLLELIENNFFRSPASTKFDEREFKGLAPPPKLEQPKARGSKEGGNHGSGGGGGGGNRGGGASSSSPGGLRAPKGVGGGGGNAIDATASPPPHSTSSLPLHEQFALLVLQRRFLNVLSRARARIAARLSNGGGGSFAVHSNESAFDKQQRQQQHPGAPGAGDGEAVGAGAGAAAGGGAGRDADDSPRKSRKRVAIIDSAMAKIMDDQERMVKAICGESASSSAAAGKAAALHASRSLVKPVRLPAPRLQQNKQQPSGADALGLYRVGPPRSPGRGASPGALRKKRSDFEEAVAASRAAKSASKAWPPPTTTDLSIAADGARADGAPAATSARFKAASKATPPLVAGGHVERMRREMEEREQLFVPSQQSHMPRPTSARRYRPPRQPADLGAPKLVVKHKGTKVDPPEQTVYSPGRKTSQEEWVSLWLNKSA